MDQKPLPPWVIHGVCFLPLQREHAELIAAYGAEEIVAEAQSELEGILAAFGARESEAP